MTKLSNCILTGQTLAKQINLDENIAPFISYEFILVGKVKVALPTLLSLINERKFHHPILAGICRNAFEKKIEPPLITQDFINNGLKNIKYPKLFKEKCNHFLKYIYNKGGSDFKTFNFFNASDYTICFAEDLDEFSNILNYLSDKGFIKWHSVNGMSGTRKRYYEVQLTDNGIEEVEKDLPNIPLIGLVEQKITTGNSIIDKKINHAKELFFRSPQTLDRMRSACETLSYILEPLRKEIKDYFSSKDIEDFFNIVNNFDIRHNKEKTKNIEHPEQLEWIFYSLLNTINTYTKIKRRN